MMHVRRLRLVGCGLLLIVTTLVAPAQAGDEAPAARAYLDHLELILDAIEVDMPAITAAAELIARPIVQGRGIVTLGDAGLAAELCARPGALAPFRNDEVRKGDAVLMVIGVARSDAAPVERLLAEQLTLAERLTAEGHLVIGLASKAQLKRHDLLRRATFACAALIDNHAPADDGLMRDAVGRAVIPTFTTANAAAAWVLVSETFAACTRQGVTPIVHKAAALDPRDRRKERYAHQLLHDDLKLAPIAAATLGGQYLRELRTILHDIGTSSWRALSDTSQFAARSVIDNGRIFIAAEGRMVTHHHGGQLAADPWLFVRLNHHAGDAAPLAPDAGDFVIALGGDDPPGQGVWDETGAIRKAGRGVAWVISGYLTHASDLRRDELLVDQQWPLGDALVKIPGYDARIGAASGVVSEAMLWMIAAQVQDNLSKHAAVDARTRR